MKKSHIITIVICLALGGLGFGKWYAWSHPEEAKEQGLIAPEKTAESKEVNNSSTTTAPVTTKALDIHPAVPVNGTYKGVIEVGASGFNCFVANIDKDKNWELVSKTFGESLAYEGFATTADVYEQMKKYIAIIAEKGVAGRNIHFVMSSGALKNPKNQLIAQAIKEKGFVVNKVDADQEGKYALKALLGKDFRDNSFTVDIGSGNTKISWMENGKITSAEASATEYEKRNAPQTVIRTIANKVNLVQKQLDMYIPRAIGIEKQEKDLIGLYDAWVADAEILKVTLDMKADEFNTLKEINDASNTASTFLKGDSEEYKLYQESLNQIETSVTEYISNIDNFDRKVKPLLENMSMDRAVSEDAGMKLIEEYKAKRITLENPNQ